MRRISAAVWQYEFAWRLSQAAGTRVRVADLRRMRRMLPNATFPGTDVAADFNRMLAQTLHAAVDLLECDLAFSRTQAVAVARDAFLDTGTWLSGFVIRLWLALDEDPFAGLRNWGLVKSAKAMWGHGMDLSETSADGRHTLYVHSCPFCAYFWNTGRTDLTPILCEWDQNWMSVINASDRPLEVSLDSTLQAGDPMCAFVFHDTKPKKRS